MLKKLVLASAFLVAGLGAVQAQSTFNAWGHDFTVPGYAQRPEPDVTVTGTVTTPRFNALDTREHRGHRGHAGRKTGTP